MEAAKRKDWNVVCEDESIVLYDSLVRAVWAKKGSKPTIVTTGSHAKTCLFGALGMDGRQLFRQYNWINSDTFLKFLKQLKRKFAPCLLFLDKSGSHKSRKVRQWLDHHSESIRVIWLPTGCPELNPVEECWRQTKNSVVACIIYPSFATLKKTLATYLRTTRFNLDLTKYLCR